MFHSLALATAVALCACSDAADRADPQVLAAVAATRAEADSALAHAAVEPFTGHEFASSFSREKAAAAMADTPEGF